MPGFARLFRSPTLISLLLPLIGLIGCSASQPPKTTAAPTAPAKPLFTPPPGILSPAAPTKPAAYAPIMLGIDVLEAEGFAAVKGKRIGLVTHPAGVNRRGVSTIDVLRRAPGVKLVALFAGEHGLYADLPAEAKVVSATDPRTGLPVHSLYPPRRPSKAMLKDLDAVVVDLQDIGTRSYTFAATMRWTMEGCFENGVEVIILDRPNPLGGLKVDGPLLDAQYSKKNYVGAFRVPYVHGLTMGELARMAKEAPGVLEVPEATRAKGKLTVIPMRGWTRSMRWPETGLNFIPTSKYVQNWEAVQGYPMTGLGSYSDLKVKFDTGFRTGVGDFHVFRGIASNIPGLKLDVLEKELKAIEPFLPGVRFVRISVPNSKTGKGGIGIYIHIIDYDAWRPCDLNFWMMKLACKYSTQNPFAPAPGRNTTGFMRHMGSQAFLNDIAAKGANVDVLAWTRTWREQARVYQEQSKRYWLYR